MACLIGLDIGTSSCKALAIDETGSILRSHQEAYPTSCPRPGWAEQDPEAWWVAASKCLERMSGLSVDAIGLTGQMHGSVFLDSIGEPLRPALLWNDMRTVEEAREIEETVQADRYRSITCNRSDPGLQAPKLLWVRRHEPAIWSKVFRVLSPKDYVAYKLTGEFATDFGDASGTGLFDTANLRFSREILDALGLGPGLFPPVLPSTATIGRDKGGRPIVVGSGDQAANGIGVGAISHGVFSIALGSSGVLYTASPSSGYHRSGTLNCFADASGKWLLMGVTLNCGTLIEWARREVLAGIAADEVSKLAAKSKSAVHFSPYVGGERCPISLSSPAFGFSSPDAGLEDMAAAVIRAITFNLRAMLPLIEETGGAPTMIRVSGGGASSSYWRQTIADTFQVPVERLGTDEGPCFGAALLAGVSIGLWPSIGAAVSQTVRTTVSELPQNDLSDQYESWRDYVQGVMGQMLLPYVSC